MTVNHHLFDGMRYDPETGFVIGKTQRKIGTLTAGYIVVSVRFHGVVYREYVHRLAFHLMGQPVPELVDHIDGDRTNNRWENLRPSSKSLNAQNLKRVRSDNTSGYLGVRLDKRSNKFVACIRVNGRNKHLGSFDVPESAYAAYISAKRKLHPHGTL